MVNTVNPPGHLAGVVSVGEGGAEGFGAQGCLKAINICINTFEFVLALSTKA